MQVSGLTLLSKIHSTKLNNNTITRAITPSFSAESESKHNSPSVSSFLANSLLNKMLHSLVTP